MDWLPYAIRTPSRAVVLALSLAGVAVAAAAPYDKAGRMVTTPPGDAILTVSGLAILVVIVGWRRFWFGPAVQLTRYALDPAFRLKVDVMAEVRRRVEQDVADLRSAGSVIRVSTGDPTPEPEPLALPAPMTPFEARTWRRLDASPDAS